MPVRVVIGFCLSIVLAFSVVVSPALAQTPEDVRGTWSGDWIPESGPRHSVTVEFSWDGDTLKGKLLNPRQVDLTEAEFDASHAMVVAEAQDPESHSTFHIEAKVEGTRLNGTMTWSEGTGELRLTKWTYVPRPRI